jgi:hypothetical protein
MFISFSGIWVVVMVVCGGRFSLKLIFRVSVSSHGIKSLLGHYFMVQANDWHMVDYGSLFKFTRMNEYHNCLLG